MHTSLGQWKHPSVIRFAGSNDPVAVMLEKASQVSLNAFQSGWSGPPFDPFALADFLNIPVVPNSEILDARTVPAGAGKVRIEYNPNRPCARMRYSLAHEIAHTFFHDVADRIRNRATRTEVDDDEWELEMICNLGAAELLMPIGSLPDIQNKQFTIREILELRQKFEVSSESILLRLIRITNEPYVLFAASRTGTSAQPRYKIDYAISSRAAGKKPPQGLILPKDSVVSACTAMGYTAVADEDWPGMGPVHLECVGLAPYPEAVYPRVAGLLRPADCTGGTSAGIQYVIGDATAPFGPGPKIVAHVVNDATPNWGAGFGNTVQRKWPEVQHNFREEWIRRSSMRLGDIFFTNLEVNLSVCQMVCQHGYGISHSPRLRYASLKECLTSLRDAALPRNAAIHMPRIGTGEAGGSWVLVSALIDETLCAAGLSVTIHDLPRARKKSQLQQNLFEVMG